MLDIATIYKVIFAPGKAKAICYRYGRATNEVMPGGYSGCHAMAVANQWPCFRQSISIFVKRCHATAVANLSL